MLSLFNGTGQYNTTTLPTNSTPPVAAFPFWYDMWVVQQTTTGIYYELSGSPVNSVIIEWITTRYNTDCDFYQFQAIYSASTPNEIRFRYYAVAPEANLVTIGVQGTGTEPSFSIPGNFVQFPTSQNPPVAPGLEITCRTVGSISCEASNFLIY